MSTKDAQHVRILLLMGLEKRTPYELRELSREIVALPKTEAVRSMLGKWVAHEAVVWHSERIEAFLLFLEECAVRNVPGMDRLITAVLVSNKSSPEDLWVAARCARLITVSSVDAGSSLWEALRTVLERLELDGRASKNLRTMPSAAIIGMNVAVPWMCERLRDGKPCVADGVAVGIGNWASSTSHAIEPVSEVSAGELAQAAADRIDAEALKKREEVGFLALDLVSMLVWALGLLAFPQTLPWTVKRLCAAFISGRGLEDAAAVRAGRHLVERFGEDARRAFAEHFDPVHLPRWNAFMGGERKEVLR